MERFAAAGVLVLFLIRIVPGVKPPRPAVAARAPGQLRKHVLRQMARFAAAMDLVQAPWLIRAVQPPERKRRRLAVAARAPDQLPGVALFTLRLARVVGRLLTEPADRAHTLRPAPMPEAERKAIRPMRATVPDRVFPAPARKAAPAPEIPMVQPVGATASALAAEAVIVRPQITFAAAAHVRLVRIPGAPLARAAALAVQAAAAAVRFIVAVVAVTLTLASMPALIAAPAPVPVHLTSAIRSAAAALRFVAAGIVVALATAADRVRNFHLTVR